MMETTQLQEDQLILQAAICLRKITTVQTTVIYAAFYDQKKNPQIVNHFQLVQNSSRPCAEHGGIWRIGGSGVTPEIVAGDWSASRPRSFDPFPPYAPQLNWRLGGPQRRYGLCRDEKNYGAPFRKRTAIPLLKKHIAPALQ